MKRVFVFNPEHDLALANGDRHYIPPKNIREMARDLAPLMERALEHFVEDENISDEGLVLQPWGWDFAVVERFKNMGVPVELLPTDTALAALSRCSERATAHHLLSAFRAEHADDVYIGESALLHQTNEISSYTERYGHVLLKAPLSGSGKGLRHVNVGDNKVESWANALIHRHGYFTAEPFYTKATDFAMEFCVRNSKCDFIGYSLFVTDHHGRYIESCLLNDEAIEERLTHYVPVDALHEVCRWVIAHWSNVVPTEWNTAKHPIHFGIDMMIVVDDSQIKLHPCVEVNLRMNMGIVAHELCRYLLAPEARGIFRLSFFTDNMALRAFSAEYALSHPATYRDGRLVKGYLPLTPICDETRHHAYILCE